MAMRLAKWFSWFLGVSMFLFGILKLVNPFKEWYKAQITGSGLGDTAYVLGILGELTVGILLFLTLFIKSFKSPRFYFRIWNLSLVMIIVMMLTGTYVHLHPNVPAEVLPLKIKPPVIPLFFVGLAVWNMILIRRK